jgi:hypothetical protein
LAKKFVGCTGELVIRASNPAEQLGIGRIE